MAQTKVSDETKRIPEVRRLAEIRAEEISNGTCTIDQLGEFDRESCWLAAESEAISQAEKSMEYQIRRTC